MSPSNGGVMRWSVVCAMVVVHAALGSTVAGTPQKVWVAAGENTTDTLTDSLLDALQYTVSDTNGDLLVNNIAVMNLDVTPDEQVAKDVEAGVQEEFDAVDKTLGEKPDKKTQGKRKNRQMSAIYQGVYVPDARFNAFVDGVMVNMVAEMRRRRMDPLYFRVLDKGVVEHVPVRRRARTDDVIVADDIQREARQEEETGEAVPVGGGVVRGLTRVRRFGNAEVQVAGNSTLVRSHYIFGPLDLEMVFETEKGTKTIMSTLTSVAGHGLFEVSGVASRFMDFIMDSPADYEIELVGSRRNKRYRRLSRAAILRLLRSDGRLEKRVSRMLKRGGKRRLPAIADQGAKDGLWPVNKPKKDKKPKDGNKDMETPVL